jgi:hypothetical protein
LTNLWDADAFNRSQINMATINDEKISTVEKEVQVDESSDEGELEELPANIEQKLNGRELQFSYAGFPWRNVSMVEGSTPAYFADVSEFTPKTPDITLHKGDKKGPTVGAAHYRFSRSVTAGVGSNEVNMVWTELKRGSLLEKTKFRFQWDGRSYILQRASSADHQKTGAQRLLLTHFKVVDEASGEMIALFISKTIGIAKGTLRLQAGIDERLGVICILGISAWRDKIRRRRRGAAGGGGGGGGDGG